MKKTNKDTALKKAKSGLLLVDSQDMDSAAVGTVGFTPQALKPAAGFKYADDDGKTPSRLSADFGSGKTPRAKCDGFGPMVFAILALRELGLNEPRLDA